MEKKIKQCKINKEGYKNVISVVYNDGTTDDRLGLYYPDEIHYDACEFINLTRQQAIGLMLQKDIAYLKR